MKEIEYGLKEARKKIEAAKLLLESGFPKDAVSRAYYAMVFAARSFLMSRGHNPKTHRDTISLIWVMVKDGKFPGEHAISLRKALELRESSDYEMLSEIGDDEAIEIVERAEKFVNYVESSV